MRKVKNTRPWLLADRRLSFATIIIAAIVVAHVGLALAFNLTIPIFESPDESNHYLFVRYLQVNKTLPIQDTNQDGPRAHHPPLYYLLAASVSAGIPIKGQPVSITVQGNQHFWFRYDDPDTENKAQWIHDGVDERWPFSGEALAVHRMRLVSTLFSVLAVVLTYAAAMELWPTRRSLALLSAALLAFNPQVLFLSGVVNNDTAGLAAAAAIVWVLSAFSRRGWTTGRWAAVGGILALGILCKTSSLALVVPVGFILAADAWRTRRWRQGVVNGAAVLITVLALAGWWFWRNQVLYGDWTANAAILALWGPLDATEQFNFHLFWTGLIGRFGLHGIIAYPMSVYAAVAGAYMILLAGWLRPAARWVTATPLRDGWRRLVTVPGFSDDARLMAMHATTIAAVIGAMIVYGRDTAWSSRYALGLYPSLAILMIGGEDAWISGPHFKSLALGVGLAALALPTAALVGLVIPTYALPETAAPAALAAATPLDAVIGDVARIRAYTLSARAVHPGEDLWATIYWEPLKQTAVPYTVFLHFNQPATGSLVQQDIYPGRGYYATTAWDVGRVFADVYRLRIPPDAAPQNGYRLLLGLYDVQTMQRLPVVGADAGSPAESWVVFGAVDVTPPAQQR